jgi:hypothetical protein
MAVQEGVGFPLSHYKHYKRISLIVEFLPLIIGVSLSFAAFLRLCQSASAAVSQISPFERPSLSFSRLKSLFFSASCRPKDKKSKLIAVDNYIQEPLTIVLGRLTCSHGCRQVIVKLMVFQEDDEVLNSHTFDVRADCIMKVFHLYDLYDFEINSFDGMRSLPSSLWTRYLEAIQCLCS